MINLPLVGRTATMPEEHPLQAITSLELVLEAEGVILVVLLEEVEELGGCLDDGEGWGLGGVEQGGDAAVGVEAEEPLVFLHVGADVYYLSGPFGAVDEGEFFEHDLRGLAVGRVLRDEV